MLCLLCDGPTRRFGRNRNGSQRYRCDTCRRTFTDEASRPIDRRRLDPAKLVFCLRLLLEGNSVRSVERLTGVHRDTVIDAMVEVGERCERFLDRVVRLLPVVDVQADEIWGFVGCKEKTRIRQGYGEAKGDAWCFVALERFNKMVLAFHVGKRSPQATLAFADKLRHATSGRFQLSTDGFRPYLTAIPEAFGQSVDYAQLVKVYGNTPEQGTAARYSPGEVVGAYPVTCIGSPDEDRICTSHAERQNLSMRMTIRRLTRLTNAHSKKWENHSAALALYFAYYNFCRVHATLKSTPAVAAGLAAQTWSVQDLLQEVSRQ
jgi:transposase-like protein/IS1 family transposase